MAAVLYRILDQGLLQYLTLSLAKECSFWVCSKSFYNMNKYICGGGGVSAAAAPNRRQSQRGEESWSWVQEMGEARQDRKKAS